MTSHTTFDISRRSLLAGAAAGAVVIGIGPQKALADDPWGVAASLATQLASPVSIPAKQVNVITYGGKKCSTTTTTAYLDSSTTTSSVSTAANSSGTMLLAQTSTTTGSYDNFVAFNNAIKACNAAGGGRVVVPAGNWYIAGPVILMSNVDFHLASGAVLYFDPTPSCYSRTDIANYTSSGVTNSKTITLNTPAATSTTVNEYLVLSRWQGNDCYNYCPPVYAYNQSNFCLSGEGTTSILNGQAGVNFTSTAFPQSAAGTTSHTGCWWTFKGSTGTGGFVTGDMGEGIVNALNTATLLSTYGSASAALLTLAEASGYNKDSSYVPAESETYVPVADRIYGTGHYLPPPMIQFHTCTNVLMENYQVTNTPFWQHNPVNCTNVTIYGVYANSNGPNNDGFDPDACRNVLIDTVTFNTGDDCIAIKAGKNNDTGYGASQNIVIQNCTMNSGHGGITLGSEMSGGVQNVYAQNLTFQNANYASNPLQIGFRIKTNLNRGGFVKNFYVRNVTIPNGITTTPSYFTPISASTSGIPASTVASSGGGILTIDCDYSPSSDSVRIRPPQVTNINISNVTVTNLASGYSCWQPIVIQGPVPSDYNGSTVLTTTPTVYPVSNVTISNCNFGTPKSAQSATQTTTGLGYIITPAYYLYNVTGLTLSNVTIGSTVYNTTLASPSTSS